MAMEVSSGKPNTTPSAVRASAGQSLRAGQGARCASSSSADSTPASAARPMATNTPDMPGASGVPTASRVIGSVTAKMATPSKPSARPRTSADMRGGLVGRTEDVVEEAVMVWQQAVNGDKEWQDSGGNRANETNG